MGRVVRIADFKNNYDGASTATRASNWGDRNVGPNSAISTQAERLRSRSRSLHRNDPWVKKGIDSLVTNEIGKGITPRFLSAANNDKLSVYWAQIVKYADPEQVLNLYGMQVQMATARRVSGEVFVRKRIRRGAGAKTPIQFQVLEADFVPVSYNENLPGGNIIRSGIEFNKRGERVAYHVYRQHPLESVGLNFGNTKLLRIRAADMIHHYMPIRPGQLRGEPDTAQAIVKAFTLNQYDDAELQRKDAKSHYTGAIEKDLMEGDTDDEDTEPESLRVQAGTMVELAVGEKINLFEGDVTGSGYADFMRQQLLAFSAGLNLPYELLTGDWSNVNDRLVRAIVNEFRRGIEAQIDHLMVFQVMQPMWEWALKAGVLSGAISLPSFASSYDDIVSTEWSGQEWPYVHPEQDIKARILEIDAKLTSATQSMLDRNVDPESVGEGLKEDQERADRYGYENTTQSTTQNTLPAVTEDVKKSDNSTNINGKEGKPNE